VPNLSNQLRNSNICSEEYAEHEEEKQAGFRAGTLCIDNIVCLKQIVQKRMATGRETYRLFIELTKAYNSIPTAKLFEVLHESHINHMLIKTLS
jgi:hypothetical protein